MNPQGPRSDRAFFFRTTRLKKEHELYQKELVDQKIKTDKLVANGAEEWDIKNSVRPSTATRYRRERVLMDEFVHAPQGKMTEESEKMIKDSQERLGKAYDELRQLVVREETILAMHDAMPGDADFTSRRCRRRRNRPSPRKKPYSRPRGSWKRPLCSCR